MRAILEGPWSSRLAWFSLVVLWGVWRLQPFYGVGMASGDQLAFSLQGTGSFWSKVLHHATAQGRVYFLFTKIIDLWLASRPEHWRVLVINISVFALSPVCFAYAACGAAAQRWLYLWLFLGFAWLGFHHLPPAAYPTVNHAPFVLWALAAYLVRRKSARGSACGWGFSLTFGVLTYLALFQYEPVACMSLLVLGWIVYSEPRAELRRPLTYAWAIGAAAYAATYAGWRLCFPTSYDGATPGAFSPWQVLRVAISYGVGGLPFSEAYTSGRPLAFGDSRIGETVLPFELPSVSAPGVIGVLLTLLGALGTFHLYRSARTEPHGARGSGRGKWLLVLALLLGINGPLGLSVKYRHWVADFDETYLTSQLALYPLVLVATFALDVAYRRWRVRGVAVVFGVCMTALAVLGVSVHGHNLEIGARQRAGMARWESMAALASYGRRIKERELVAPDLFYTVFAGGVDWGGYWHKYFRQRFGGDFRFRATPRADKGEFARLRLHRFDDGRLRALSIQTRDYVAIVARPTNMPALLVSSERIGVPIDWKHAELLENSGYVSVTLAEPASLLGAEQNLELVWLVPSGELATNP